MQGTITKLASFGAFARVKGGLEGLIHLSELSYEKIDLPSDVVSEGQEVEVKIIKIEEERKRLGLSLLLDKEIEDESGDSDNDESTVNEFKNEVDDNLNEVPEGLDSSQEESEDMDKSDSEETSYEEKAE